MEILAYVTALIWGVVWALTLQYSQIGKFLAVKRTWITVVIGVGVDLLIVLIAIPKKMWARVEMIVAASSVGIIARSLINEWVEMREMLRYADKNTDSE